ARTDRHSSALNLDLPPHWPRPAYRRAKRYASGTEALHSVARYRRAIVQRAEAASPAQPPRAQSTRPYNHSHHRSSSSLSVACCLGEGAGSRKEPKSRPCLSVVHSRVLLSCFRAFVIEFLF